MFVRHNSLWKEVGFIYQKGDFKFYNHTINRVPTCLIKSKYQDKERKLRNTHMHTEVGVEKGEREKREIKASFTPRKSNTKGPS